VTLTRTFHRIAHRGRPSVPEAVGRWDLPAHQRIPFRRGLDPFGDQGGARRLDVVPQPCRQCLAGRVRVDVADQSDVQLHEVGLEPQDVPEAGVPGIGVVGRDPHPRAPVDGGTHGRVAQHLDMLGDLDHQRRASDATDVTDSAMTDAGERSTASHAPVCRPDATRTAASANAVSSTMPYPTSWAAPNPRSGRRPDVNRVSASWPRTAPVVRSTVGWYIAWYTGWNEPPGIRWRISSRWAQRSEGLGDRRGGDGRLRVVTVGPTWSKANPRTTVHAG